MSEKFVVQGRNVVWTTPALAAIWKNRPGAKVVGRIVVWNDHDQAVAHTGVGNFMIKEDEYLQLREDGSREERE